MADPFLGEIRLMSFGYAPRSWALCNGQSLPTAQNQALYNLLGNMYGGDKVNFLLPNLQGRVPVHFGEGLELAQAGGEPSHTLTLGEMPAHPHTLNGTIIYGTSPVPVGNLLAKTAPANPYVAPNALQGMNGASISNVGGSEAHENMQPYLAVAFCIALMGIFPSQN